MIPILVTVLLFVIMVIMLRKGFQIITTLMVISVAALLGYVVVTGNSPGETSGSAIIDIFELIVSCLKSRFSAMLIIPMCVMAYGSYMDTIGASMAFTRAVTKQVGKIKNKYIIVGMLVPLISLMIFAIPSPMSCISLLFTSFIPVLLTLGCTKESITSALICGTCILMGPANPNTLLTLSGLGLLETIDVVSFALTKQIFIGLSMVVILAVVVPIVNKYFDKKDKLDLSAKVEISAAAAETKQVPKIYAFFPIMPLVLVILFSKVVVKSITISVVAAQFLAFLIVLIVQCCVSRTGLKECFEETNHFYLGMGKYIGGLAMVPVMGAVLSAAIELIGGLNIIVNMLSAAGMGFNAFMVVLSLLLLFVSFVTANVNGSLTLILPIAVKIISATGGSPIAAACIIGQTACFGSALSLIYPSTLMMQSLCGVNILSVVKRNIIPVGIASACTIVLSLILYG